jgi:hypothetical protein
MGSSGFEPESAGISMREAYTYISSLQHSGERCLTR